MRTTHTIAAIRSGNFNGMDWEAEYVITYSYVRGAAPIIHPADNADPGCPAEIEFVSISPGASDVGAFTDPAQRDLEEWAADWLDENRAAAIESAEDDMQPDPDYARDLALEYAYFARETED